MSTSLTKIDSASISDATRVLEQYLRARNTGELKCAANPAHQGFRLHPRGGRIAVNCRICGAHLVDLSGSRFAEMKEFLRLMHGYDGNVVL